MSRGQVFYGRMREYADGKGKGKGEGEGEAKVCVCATYIRIRILICVFVQYVKNVQFQSSSHVLTITTYGTNLGDISRRPIHSAPLQKTY